MRDHEFVPDRPGWYVRFGEGEGEGEGGCFFDTAYRWGQDAPLAVLGPYPTERIAGEEIERFSLDFVQVLLEAERAAGREPVRFIDPEPGIRAELTNRLDGLDGDALAEVLRFAQTKRCGAGSH